MSSRPGQSRVEESGTPSTARRSPRWTRTRDDGLRPVGGDPVSEIDGRRAGLVSTDAAAPAPRALVFVNPVAPHHDAAALRHALDTAFEGAYRIVETTSEGNASGSIADEIVRASEQGCDLVVAAGGDGTVSLLADSLASQPAQRRMRLAIVPLGTANVLARKLQTA